LYDLATDVKKAIILAGRNWIGTAFFCWTPEHVLQDRDGNDAMG
jgi:hypothetical protein